MDFTIYENLLDLQKDQQLIASLLFTYVLCTAYQTVHYQPQNHKTFLSWTGPQPRQR